MAKRFSNKLYTLNFVIISAILIAISIIFFFASIKPFLLEQKIIKLNNILLPEAEYAQNQLNKAITLSQIVSSNIKTFFTPNSPMFLSDEYLQTLSNDILKNNYYIQGMGFIISGDIELSITGEDYLTDRVFSALWQKNFNEQIQLQHFSLKDINNPNLLLECKHLKRPVIGKPFLYNRQGINTLIQPIASPIFVMDKFIGIDVVFLSLDFMDEIYKFHINDISQDKLVLFNKQGTILFYPFKLNIGNSIESIIPKNSINLIRDINHKRPISTKYGDYFVVGKYITTSQSDQLWVISLFTQYSAVVIGIYLILFLLIIISLAISGLVVLIISMVSTSYSDIFSTIHKSITNIYMGHLNERVEILSSFSETDEITHSLERLRLRLLTLVELQNKLAERNYTDRLSATNPTDLLANSINNAFEKIIQRWKDRKEIEESKRRSDWINKGLSDIYEAARVQENSYQRLGRQILDKFIKHTNAVIAGFFVYDKTSESLKSVVTFAYEQEHSFERDIKPGHGYIGNAILEKKMTYIRHLPVDYKVLVIGLGETRPKSALILPLVLNNEIQGVIELLFLRELQDYELEFFERTSIVVAQAIKSIQVNIETERLLEQTINQAKELEKARKLLQEHIKELEDREKELNNSQAQMKGILDAVNYTLITVEYTTDGTFVSGNELFYKKMEYSPEDLEDVNIIELVPDEGKKELRDILKRVSKGEHISKIVQRQTKYGQKLWLYATYTPYYDIEGKITRILFFAFDITETFNQIQELKSKIEELNEQIKLLEKALKEV